MFLKVIYKNGFNICIFLHLCLISYILNTIQTSRIIESLYIEVIIIFTDINSNQNLRIFFWEILWIFRYLIISLLQSWGSCSLIIGNFIEEADIITLSGAINLIPVPWSLHWRVAQNTLRTFEGKQFDEYCLCTKTHI